ncbi:hypothetical protein TNIN_324711 [Trichonephila inaurata madagascariensis]|uniref:Reverse transcriptase domain-containing protein n=1 Tax=Trichonephila inaurata madagascariensis TaxID=2747483 RepID=A0A8X6XRD8_9ARAC|nr:hypothetical protein TNIN_324711 [Trichonephila inaurata madagascariensis]
MLFWIKSSLSQRFCAIRFGNSVPSFKQTGLHQGTVIGPLLFNILINDLPGILTSNELMPPFLRAILLFGAVHPKKSSPS